MANLPLPPWGFSGLHWLLLGRPVGCAEKGEGRGELGCWPGRRERESSSLFFFQNIVSILFSKLFLHVERDFETSNFMQISK
jgi:hypothetical protein